MDITGPTSHSFISQRLKLHYVDWGNPDAPPLILQHGGRDHCRSWDWMAQELRRDWHVICPDLRGHGDSSWSPDGDYSMASLVYDFAQLVHGLGYDQVDIIAHSLGGAITAAFTGIYPEKVRRFVNIEGLILPRRDFAEEHPALGARMRDWIAERRQAAGRQPRRYKSLDEAFKRMKEANAFLNDQQARHLTIHGTSRNEDGTWSWKYDNYTYSFQRTEIAEAEILSLWRAITCPVLLLWGRDSFFSDPREDGRLDPFADARLIYYENAGHWLHHDRLDTVLADVTRFLAE